MIKMVSLNNGVLLKLLNDMKMDENTPEDDPRPVLLQIRSIVPVLQEGDQWPNIGFFLKVSDSSHALYVSLPEEQNEMILRNKSKLGQLIYVHKLENAHPVLLLRGLTPIPGRRPCGGDIISPANLVQLLDASFSMDSIVDKGVILEKKISKGPSISRKFMGGLLDSESLGNKGERLEGGGYFGKSRSLSACKTRPGEIVSERCVVRAPDFEKNGFDVVGKWNKSRPSSIGSDSDVDSVISLLSSTRIGKSRSWNESEILGVKEIFDSSVVKHETKPHCRSANVSPVRSIRYDSSDDNSSTTSRKRNVAFSWKLVKCSTKSQDVSKVKRVQISASSLCNLVQDRKGAEIRISWISLPSNLAKLGKVHHPTY